ncbi:DUF4238 domain-containing protein [Aquabacterium fontiphilum]|uniref:DUF4238 domain-containing protein n=1 Tax=Aquabacterium fontiphilum TaxID=450365 RepID=UPI0013781354|nr:DUF4238 domain-containing protein [Aquabacterium fontiphilum]
MTHKRHHYVPVFLLRGWAGPDGAGIRFCWRNGGVKAEECSPRSVCFQEHLYSVRSSAGEMDASIERDFWGPSVDDPAALVHAKMLTEGVCPLTAHEREVWSRFLVAQLLRVPRAVSYIRARGVDILKGVSASDGGHRPLPDGEVEELGPWGLTWAEMLNPLSPEDLGVLTLPSLVYSDVLNAPCLAARWEVRDLSRSPVRLVLGDVPLFYAGRLDRDFLLVLPLGPHSVFCAYSSPATQERLARVTDHGLVKLINRQTCEQAALWVYGADSSLRPLVERRLRRPT